MAKQVGQQEYVEISAEELKEKYNLSPEDLDFYTKSKKILEDSGCIGIHKYHELIEKRGANERWNEANPLKDPKVLTDLEKLQIVQFETDRQVRNQNAVKKRDEYKQQLDSGKAKPIEYIEGVPVNKETLYFGFLKAYKIVMGKEFLLTDYTTPNLEAIIKYFCKDDSFFKCARLVTEIDGVQLEPSFDKGFLIVGAYGNGKSSIIKTLEFLINHNYKLAIAEKWKSIPQWNELRFKIKNCHDLVSEFEGLNTPDNKNHFFKTYGNFKYSFDDLKKEKIASNYGLTNVVQSVLEKRYDNKAKTFGTMNYKQEKDLTEHEKARIRQSPKEMLSIAIEEIGAKYGEHLYDRVFEMWNIIEFQGPSFRK